jgi:alcohol dehydrogenase
MRRASIDQDAVAEIRTSSDALVRMLTSVVDGVRGYHGVGIVEQRGADVRLLTVGDSVLVACIGACGHCAFCVNFMYSLCTTGRWMLADLVAEQGIHISRHSKLVRIPYADKSLTRLCEDGSLGRAAAVLAHHSKLKRILDAYDRAGSHLPRQFFSQ